MMMAHADAVNNVSVFDLSQMQNILLQHATQIAEFLILSTHVEVNDDKTFSPLMRPIPDNVWMAAERTIEISTLIRGNPRYSWARHTHSVSETTIKSSPEPYPRSPELITSYPDSHHNSDNQDKLMLHRDISFGTPSQHSSEEGSFYSPIFKTDLDMNMFETTNEISGMFAHKMLETDSAEIIHPDTTNDYQGIKRNLSERVDTATLLPDIVFDTELHNYSLPTSGRHSPVVHSDKKAKINNKKMNDVKSFILPSSRPEQAAAWKVIDKAHGTMQKLKKAGIDTNEKWQTGLENVVPKVCLETVKEIIQNLKLGTKQSHSDYIPALAAILYFKFCSSKLPLTLDKWRGEVRSVYENNVIELQREKCLQEHCNRTAM